jgi:hypothetical protein
MSVRPAHTVRRRSLISIVSRVTGSGTGALNWVDTAEGSRRWARWMVAVIALAALGMAVPAVPATWASLAAWGSVADTASGGGGTVAVKNCSRGLLVANWHCQGTFEYSDPEEQGWRITRNVVLANDPSHYVRGAQVGASLKTGTHRAYLWGNSYAAGVLVRLLGFFVLCALAVVLLWRPRRVRTWVSGGILILGIACLSPTIADLWFTTASTSSSSTVGSVPPATSRPSP